MAAAWRALAPSGGGVVRLACALAVVVALAACGKSADDKYRDGFPPIDRDLAALSAEVGAGLRAAGGSDDAPLARRFDGYARRLGDLRDRLDDLDPPGPLEDAHRRLLAAAGATHRALADVAEAARVGDAAGAGAAATRVVRSGQEVDSARRKIANSGFFQ
jgi:hypothetical protein